MFKQILIFITGLLLSVQLYSRKDTTKLNKAYHDLMNGKKKAETTFFYSFPSSFSDFYMIYLKPNIKYHLLDQHVAAFCDKLSSIPSDVYYKKLVSLSIGGRWEVGAESLREMIQKHTEKEPQKMLDALSKFSKGYQLRFWQFYWSSLVATHNYRDEYVKLRSVLYPLSPEQTKIMDIAFDFAWKELDVPDSVF
ncbi:MAG: hypothetical protein LBG92_09565 [Prevotellaceae bacterium]|jgi:hypothetical protein|nr:hypothetical protein [Prevotellaceae bacterium]